MLKLLARLFSRRHTARRLQETRLGLETLERREVPSAFTDHFGHRRPAKPTIHYQVTIDHNASDHVRRMTAKKNLLTLHNLPPGSYSASYRSYTNFSGYERD